MGSEGYVYVYATHATDSANANNTNPFVPRFAVTYFSGKGPSVTVALVDDPAIAAVMAKGFAEHSAARYFEMPSFTTALKGHELAEIDELLKPMGD